MAKNRPTFRQLLGKNIKGITPVTTAGATAAGGNLAVPNTPNPNATGSPVTIAPGPDIQTVPGAIGGMTPKPYDPAAGITSGYRGGTQSGTTPVNPANPGWSPQQQGLIGPTATPSGTIDSASLTAATAAMQAARPVETPASPMTPEQIAAAGATQQAGIPTTGPYTLEKPPPGLGQAGIATGQVGAPVQTDMMAPMQPGQAGVPGQPGVTTGGQAGDMQPPMQPGQPGTATGGAPSSTTDLIGQFQGQQDLANQANEARYGQMMNMYDQILGVYGPGGGFGAGFLSDLERTKQQDVAQATQSLASSGLYGTTRTAGLGAQWEQQVGSQARLNLADQLAQRYTGALGQKAEAVERREDVAPDPALMANLVTGAEAGPGGTTGAGGAGAGGAGAGSAGGETGADAGTVDISQYWETGQFSPDAAVRAFSSASPADQETFLRQGVKRINTMGQRVQNKETRLETLRAKVEAEDDPKKKQSIQRNITRIENELANVTQKRDAAQSAYDEMLQSRTLTAQAYGAGGAVGEYAQQQAAMREYQQQIQTQQQLATQEAARRAEEIKLQASAPYEAAQRQKDIMTANLRSLYR